LQEIASVALSKGIDISAEVEISLKSAKEVPYDSSTSMHLDFQNNRLTEIESLSGYILREGELNGVHTPLMKKLYLALSE